MFTKGQPACEASVILGEAKDLALRGLARCFASLSMTNFSSVIGAAQPRERLRMTVIAIAAA